MLGLFRKSADKQTVDKKSQTKDNAMNQLKQKSFGGMSGEQLKNVLNKSGNSPKMSLVSQEISNSAKNAISEVSKDKTNYNNNLMNGIKVSSSNKLFEEIATLFAEGEEKSALDILRQHIKDNKGEVDKKYWFMLLDIYQVNNQKAEFEKTALIFANQFNCSAPSWPNEFKENDKTSITGKNLLILNKINEDEKEKIKEFIINAKEEKFCRLDVSKLKFEESNLEGFDLLLNTMYELRKSKVLSLLLGENNILNFSKQYIKFFNNIDNNDNSLNKVYYNNQVFWLLYLEVLQWKNRMEEFEDLAIEYAVEFELSAPGWDDNGVMKIESSIVHQQITEDIEVNSNLPEIITTENVQELFTYINEKAKQIEHEINIDMKEIQRIDFASAGSLLGFTQEFLSKNNDKKITLTQPNELIYCLLETIGLTDILQIIPKKR